MHIDPLLLDAWNAGVARARQAYEADERRRERQGSRRGRWCRDCLDVHDAGERSAA